MNVKEGLEIIGGRKAREAGDIPMSLLCRHCRPKSKKKKEIKKSLLSPCSRTEPKGVLDYKIALALHLQKILGLDAAGCTSLAVGLFLNNDTARIAYSDSLARSHNATA